jgi:hypothetical protein
MTYAELNAARRAYASKHGNEAARKLILKHGGKDEDDNAALSSVPEKNWPALARDLAVTASNDKKPQSVADLDASKIYGRWNNPPKVDRSNER